MKLLIVSTLLVFGLCHAEPKHSLESTGTRGALKRVVKRAAGNMGGAFLLQTEASIITNCKANGFESISNDLQESFDELKKCVGKKTLFKDPKEEYIANMEECAQEPIRKTELCLKEDQKYFPKFILDLAKSVVNFMYDDFDIMRVNLPVCIVKFQYLNVQRKYLQCLSDTAQKTNDTIAIPSSKESFCQKFIPASRCFTDTIKEECEDTTKLSKFRNDYMESMTKPCNIKEA